MKKIVLTLVVIMLVSFGSAAFLLAQEGGFSPQYWEHKIRENIVTLSEEQSFVAAEFDTLDLRTVSADIRLLPAAGDEIVVHLRGTTNNPAQLHFSTGTRSKTLAVEIRQESDAWMGINMNDINLDVFIPESFTEKVTIKTSSGDVTAEQLALKDFNFSTSSGDLEGVDLTVDEMLYDSSSGDIYLASFAGKLSSKTISGDLEVDYKTLAHNFTAESGSGNVILTLPAESNFTYKVKTVSGQTRHDFGPISHLPDGEYTMAGYIGEEENDITITVNTISGDVNLKKH